MAKPARVESTQVDDRVAPPGPAAPVIPVTGARRRRAFLRRLAAMTAEERLASVRAGRFTRAERTAWAARYPEEVPLVNGELPWIALRLP